MKGGGKKEVGEGGRRKEGGAQWAVPSSKDSTPESQVLAASFSCRLLMISCSSEPELLWRPKTGGGEGRRRKRRRRENEEEEEEERRRSRQTQKAY